MSYLDIIEELCPGIILPNKRDYIYMYNTALEMLNTIKLSRFKALYFGSMQIGPDVYEWNGKHISDFTQKYLSVSMLVLGDLYEKLKDKPQELVEVSLSMLYSMLSLFMTTLDLADNIDSKLVAENDKYVYDNDPDLTKEFED